MHFATRTSDPLAQCKLGWDSMLGVAHDAESPWHSCMGKGGAGWDLRHSNGEDAVRPCGFPIELVLSNLAMSAHKARLLWAMSAHKARLYLCLSLTARMSAHKARLAWDQQA